MPTVEEAMFSVVGGGAVALALRVYDTWAARRAKQQDTSDAAAQELVEAGLNEAAEIRRELRQVEKDLRTELTTAQTEAARLNAKVVYLDAQNNALNQRVAALSLERDTYYRELERERTIRDRIQAELGSTRSELELAKQSLKQANERIADLERQVASLQSNPRLANPGPSSAAA